MRTTCNNFECPDRETCTFNIHKGGERPCKEGFYYMSQKQASWKYYTEKCEKEGREPMPYNIYFGH